MDYSIDKILEIAKTKNYKIFDNDTKPYNINLWGCRSKNVVSNKFMDWLLPFWWYQGKFSILKFPFTTNPGTDWLKDPMSNKGCAILKEGQYPGMWKIGTHISYMALIQDQTCKPCMVIRDYNKDSILDFNSGVEESGIFNINCHRSTEGMVAINVGKASAGCQVFQSAFDFETFMSMVRQASMYCGNSFTYTLVNEKDFES